MKIEHRKSDNDKDLAKEWNLDPIFANLFITRGITTKSDLIYDIQNLLPPTLKGIDEACCILADAISLNKKIRIIGDYDTDGATSTALAMRFFQEISYKNVDYYIPNRHEEGYGINNNIVKKAKDDNVDLIITVDNGICANESINLARTLGIDVVVTDHHIPSRALPNANAIVNPKQNDCPFPSKNLAGVGVIFYVLIKVRTELKSKKFFEKNNIAIPIMSNYLDLVAIGTISDMVPLDYNNRLMVNYGIGLIRKKTTSKGVEHLIRINGGNCANFKSSDISYVISPLLNSAGRIAEMKYGVDCLLAKDVNEAKVQANILYAFNNKRKDIEKQMMSDALFQISNQKQIKSSIIVYGKEYNVGVIGIIAAKLKDKYGVPVIVFAPINDNKLAGSARSTDYYHIQEGLSRINDEHPELLLAFGGHKGAAGLTIDADNLSVFKEIFDKDLTKNRNLLKDEEPIYITDGALPNVYFSPSFVRAVVFDQPWGMDFPSPNFDGIFYVSRQMMVSDKLLSFNLRLDNGNEVRAVYFNYDKELWSSQRARVIQAIYSFDACRNSNDSSFNLIIREAKIIQTF
ncbi:MAG: single-stranded-DNA-specific exonuclease RecJ [Succinivibrionaceae bacterium]